MTTYSILAWGLLVSCVALPMLISIFIFSLQRRRDVVELSETRLRLLGIIVLCTTLVLANTVVGMRLIETGLTQGQLGNLLLGFAALGPMVAAAFSYLTLEWRYARAYGGWLPIEALPAYAGIVQTVKGLAEEMELARQPAILVSPLPGVSPFCFGRRMSRVSLVLPTDLLCLVDIASSERPHITKGLLRFILGHELAHIKNGDCSLMAWVAIFLRDLGVAMPAYAVLLGVCLITTPAEPLHFAAMLGFAVSLLGTILLHAVAASTARHRELLADARSSLYLSELEVGRIVGIQTEPQGTSPFERFITCLSMSRAIGTASRIPTGRRWQLGQHFRNWLSLGSGLRLGAFSHWVHRPPRLLFDGHPSLSKRILCLRAKTHLERHAPYPSWSAAFQIQFIAVFAVFAGATSIAALLTGPNYTSDNTQQTARIAAIILCLPCFIYPGIAFALPARSSGARPSMGLRDFFVLLARQVVSLLLSVVLGGALGYAALRLIFINGSPLRDTLYQCAAILCSVGIMPFGITTVLAFLSDNPKYAGAVGTRTIRVSLRYWILPLVVSLGFLVLLAFVVHPFCVVIGFTVGLSLSFLLLHRRMEVHESVDGVLALGAFGLSANVERPSRSPRAIFLMTLFSVSVLTIPSAALALGLQLALVAVATTEVPVIPVEVVLAIVLVSYLVFYRLASFDKSVGVRLALARECLGTLCIFGCSPPQESEQALEQFLLENQGSDGGYPLRTGGHLSCMETTYNAAVCCQMTGMATRAQAGMAGFIASCLHPQGGFGFWPQCPPRFAPTYWALTALAGFGQHLDDSRRKATAAWIMSHQKHPAPFGEPCSRRALIEETFYAVGSLKILGCLQHLNVKSLADDIRSFLERTNLGLDQAQYAVRILAEIGELDAHTRSMVRRRFVSPWKAVVSHLPLHSHLPEVAGYIRLAALVLEGDQSELNRLLPGMGERFRGSFESRIMPALPAQSNTGNVAQR